MALIDGKRSVAEIAAALGHEPLEIGLALRQPIARGLVNLKPPQRTTAKASPAPARLSQPPAQPVAAAPGRRAAPEVDEPFGGFFEWLLTGRSKEMPAVWFFALTRCSAVYPLPKRAAVLGLPARLRLSALALLRNLLTRPVRHARACRTPVRRAPQYLQRLRTYIGQQSLGA